MLKIMQMKLLHAYFVQQFNNNIFKAHALRIDRVKYNNAIPLLLHYVRLRKRKLCCEISY